MRRLFAVIHALDKGDKLPPRLLTKALRDLKSQADREKDRESKDTLKNRYEVFKRLTDSIG